MRSEWKTRSVIESYKSPPGMPYQDRSLRLKRVDQGCQVTPDRVEAIIAIRLVRQAMASGIGSQQGKASLHQIRRNRFPNAGIGSQPMQQYQERPTLSEIPMKVVQANIVDKEVRGFAQRGHHPIMVLSE
jgi:hypothetical protein